MNFNSLSWRVRIISQFKDGRLRVQFYDDGNNVYVGQSTSLAAGTYRITTLVQNRPTSVEAMSKFKYSNWGTRLNWESDVLKTLESLEKYMLSYEEKKKDGDW